MGDIQQDLLDEIAQEIKSAGGEVYTQVVDVWKRDAVDSWIKETIDRYGKLDGAANIAGVTGENHGKMKIEDFDEDEWDFIMDINLKGV